MRKYCLTSCCTSRQYDESLWLVNDSVQVPFWFSRSFSYLSKLSHHFFFCFFFVMMLRTMQISFLMIKIYKKERNIQRKENFIFYYYLVIHPFLCCSFISFKQPRGQLWTAFEDKRHFSIISSHTEWAQTFLELTWCERFGSRKKKLKICRHVFPLVAQRQNRSCHDVKEREWQRKVHQWKTRAQSVQYFCFLYFSMQMCDVLVVVVFVVSQ